MNKYIIKTFMLSVVFAFVSVVATHSEKFKKSHFSMYAGLGKVHYFNNMDLTLENDQEVYIEQDSWGVSGKFMWEPGHRLNIGLETGYYRMYIFFYKDRSVAADIVPIMLNINMRIVDNFSLGVGTGVVLLNNRSDVYSQTSSIANYQALANYVFPVSKHWKVGAEVRYLWIGKTNDNCMTMQLIAGYRF